MVKIYIDRPIGSLHPTEPDIVYALNYGHILGIFSEDREELDVYILDATEPLDQEKEYNAICRGVIHRENDNEDKMIACLDPRFIVSKDKIKEKTFFQEKYFQIKIYV